MARNMTKKMIDMVHENYFDKETLIINLLNWMSEADVAEFMENEGLLNEDEDEDEYDW